VQGSLASWPSGSASGAGR